MTIQFPPPALVQSTDLQAALHRQGYTVLGSAQVCALTSVPLARLLAWQRLWDDLPPDHYLRDGGRYRRRRHSCFTIDGDVVLQSPHRAHWQPVECNALHGGMERHFEPISAQLVADVGWHHLLTWLGRVCSGLRGGRTWFAEAHQFRIDTTDGIGRPTPEGAHRDGVDLVAVFLVNRQGVKGGETRVFDAEGPNGQRFTLSELWSVLLQDDARVIHESTPIQPEGQGGFRDTLVVTLRANGFQGASLP
jgi:hypothetical protein